MAITLSAKGESLLADMPAFYREDANALAVIDALARELQRVEDLLTTLRSQVFPQNADDTYHLLGLWERLLGLPVEPAGVPLDIRRNRLVSAVRSRRSGSGANWIARVSEAIGANNWDYVEDDPGDYTISILLPYQPSAITALNLEHTLPDATIDVDDASVLATSGTVRIGDQFVDYTGKSTNTLTGCTGGTGTWPDGTSVTQGTQYTTGQAESLLRAITPAHLDLEFGYDSGFPVDMGLVDMEPV